MMKATSWKSRSIFVLSVLIFAVGVILSGCGEETKPETVLQKARSNFGKANNYHFTASLSIKSTWTFSDEDTPETNVFKVHWSGNVGKKSAAFKLHKSNLTDFVDYFQDRAGKKYWECDSLWRYDDKWRWEINPIWREYSSSDFVVDDCESLLKDNLSINMKMDYVDDKYIITADLISDSISNQYDLWRAYSGGGVESDMDVMGITDSSGKIKYTISKDFVFEKIELVDMKIDADFRESQPYASVLNATSERQKSEKGMLVSPVAPIDPSELREGIISSKVNVGFTLSSFDELDEYSYRVPDNIKKGKHTYIPPTICE